METIRRNKGPTVVVVDKSSKSCLGNDDKQRNEHVRDHLVTNYEAIDIPMENDGHVERFVKYKDILRGSDTRMESDGRFTLYTYVHSEEPTNIAFLDDHLYLCEALKSKYASKWKVVMQKKYNSFVANNT